MSYLAFIIILLSISFCECRYFRPNKEIQNAETTYRWNFEGSRDYRIIHHHNYKKDQNKVMTVRKLLGFEFQEEKLELTELVTMDYQTAQRGPSVHNK